MGAVFFATPRAMTVPASALEQHELPLLTNDRDFDRIVGLTVTHW